MGDRLRTYLKQEHGVDCESPVEAAIELIIKQETLIHNIQLFVNGMIAEGDITGNAASLAEYIQNEMRQF